jgi:uncharacterized membrane protein YciS (DUF1049 family)
MRFVYWGLTAVIGVICAIFAAYNKAMVTLDLWPFPAFEVSTYLAVLTPLVVGFIFGWLITWLGHFGTRRERRRLARQTERLQGELDRARADQVTTPAPGRSLAG